MDNERDLSLPDSGDGKNFPANLRRYAKAIQEEWETSQPTEEDTPEEIAKKARKLVIANFPMYIERASLLAIGANSESVSMQAIKFLYSILVPNNTVTPGTPDPMEELFRQLVKNDEKQGSSGSGAS